MNVRYRVELSQSEREQLTGLLSGGKQAVRKLKWAQILLAADPGASDEDIATSLGTSGSTVYRTKQRFVLGSLEAALSEQPRPGASRSARGSRSKSRSVQQGSPAGTVDRFAACVMAFSQSNCSL